MIFMTSFKEILKDECKEEFDKIFAHKKTVNTEERFESLEDHSNKTLEMYDYLIETFKLDVILNQLIKDVYKELQISQIPDNEFIDYCNYLLRSCIYYHDWGKINVRFQKKKLGNYYNFRNFNSFDDLKHSKYGKVFLDYYLISHLFKKEWYSKLDYEERIKISYITIILSSIVDRHHSFLMDRDFFLFNNSKKRFFISDKEVPLIESFIDKNFKIEKVNNLMGVYKEVSWYSSNLLKFKEEITNSQLSAPPTLFYLYKLAYSLLITADYYSTNWFFLDKKPQLNVFDKDLVSSLDEAFYKNKEYNRKLQNQSHVKDLREKSPNFINDMGDLRTKILLEASYNLKEALEKNKKVRIFYLNVPTGGGKTNISIRLMLDLLSSNSVNNIKRVYYVFPYVNIIEQNFDVIRETLLTDNKTSPIISEIYYYKEWDLKSNDANSEDEREYYLNNEFLNYPITVISNVNFFNTFIKNDKKINFKCANFCNSIVILDEIQTLPHNKWLYFSKLLYDLAEKYNIYFIIMSATLPNLTKLLKKSAIEPVYLIKEPKTYFSHQLFQRNKIVDIKIEDNFEKIKEIIVKFAKKTIKKKKILCVLNTIKKSRELFEYLKNNLPQNDFEFYLLNSTILSWRRKEILKKFENNPDGSSQLKKNIILVSTQVVEAGVDINCDLGFRDYAPLDSIEQIAGRINREGKEKRTNSKIYLIDTKTADSVYQRDPRLAVQKQQPDIISLLNEKDFNSYYEDVFGEIQKREDEYSEQTFELVEPQGNLLFEELAKKQYIETENFVLFVPLEIPKEVFSPDEIFYLEKLMRKKISKTVDGHDVWDLFKLIVNLRTNYNDFLQNQIEYKKIQSILNKFTISVICKGSQITKNIEFNRDFEYVNGILKIESEGIKEKIYSLETGLNLEKFRELLKINGDNII